eukprot:55772-Eustigmatos_ZCMA.PRE.1
MFPAQALCRFPAPLRSAGHCSAPDASSSAHTSGAGEVWVRAPSITNIGEHLFHLSLSNDCKSSELSAYDISSAQVMGVCHESETEVANHVLVARIQRKAPTSRAHGTSESLSSPTARS